MGAILEVLRLPAARAHGRRRARRLLERAGVTRSGALAGYCTVSLLSIFALGCGSERRADETRPDAGHDAASRRDTDAVDAISGDTAADLDASEGADMAEVDGGDRRCDPLRDDGVLCECTLPGFQPLDPSWPGYRVYCCDERDDRPWGCLWSEGGQDYVYWFDMSRFGSRCGGRDFPYEQAIDSCPWQE